MSRVRNRKKKRMRRVILFNLLRQNLTSSKLLPGILSTSDWFRRSKLTKQRYVSSQSNLGETMIKPYREDLQAVQKRMLDRRNLVEKILISSNGAPWIRWRRAPCLHQVVESNHRCGDSEEGRIVHIEILKKQKDQIERDLAKIDEESRKLGRSSSISR